MTLLVPAALLGAAVAVAIGLPAPRRQLVKPLASPARSALSDRTAALAVTAVLVVPAGPVGAGVGGLLALLLLRARTSSARGAARRLERQGAVEGMAVLAAELRAGRMPAAALRHAAGVSRGPFALALQEAGAAAGLGEEASTVLRRHVARSAAGHVLESLAVCWEVCAGAGSSLAASVERLENALREDQAVREEVDTELEGHRSTALVLCGMPVLGLGIGAGMGGNPLHVLLHTPIGWTCLLLGLGLELAGVAWTSRIVRGAGGLD